jgi:hypothetical protein
MLAARNCPVKTKQKKKKKDNANRGKFIAPVQGWGFFFPCGSIAYDRAQIIGIPLP